MRALALSMMLLAGCSDDPCDGLSGGCISLDVVTFSGPLEVDQILVTADAIGFDQRPTPPVAGPTVRLPVRFAVRTGAFQGSFELYVDCLHKQRRVCESSPLGGTISPRQHQQRTIDVFATQEQFPDLAPNDLAGVDLASPAPTPDLASTDLAQPAAGPQWSKVTYNGPFLNAILARSATDVWFAGDNGTVLHSTGNDQFAFQSVSLGSLNRAHAIISNGSDLWVAGERAIAHSTGNGVWMNENADMDFYGAFAIPGGDLIAGGVCLVASCNTSFTRSTGNGTWTRQTSPASNAILDVFFATSPSDVYLTGSGGIIYHSTGGGFTPQNSTGTTDQFFGMWGSGTTDLYAITQKDLFHSTGDGNWTKQFPPAPQHFWQAIHGSGPTDVYLAGTTDATTATQKLLFHSTGNGVWTTEATPQASQFSAVFAVSAGEAYLTGYDQSTPIVFHKK
jgi:hypothetical protein